MAEKKTINKEDKYVAGLYRSKQNLRVIRSLVYNEQKAKDGTVTQVVAGWQKEENFIKFTTTDATTLTEEDMKLVPIRQLIDSHIIYRAYE